MPGAGRARPSTRLDKEIKCRDNVFGLFPNDAAVLRFVGAILAKRHGGWRTSSCRSLTTRAVTVPNHEQPSTL